MKRSLDRAEPALDIWQEPKMQREPLRLLTEMAEEFGVTPKTLGQLLGRRDGPRPAIARRANVGLKTYYTPSEIRKWWKEVGSL